MLVMLSREQWASSPGLFSNPPNVYFGCRWCQAPVRYAGLLTRDGYAVQPVTCEGCGRAFELLLHGWGERPADVTVPAGVERTRREDFGRGTSIVLHGAESITSHRPIGQADGDAD